MTLVVCPPTRSSHGVLLFTPPSDLVGEGDVITCTGAFRHSPLLCGSHRVRVWMPDPLVGGGPD